MGAQTLARASTFAFDLANVPGYAAYRKDNGVYVVERAPVFRSGTFRDSAGRQTTYEKLHIAQMIANYDYLRNNKIFADIPVRDGHAGWMLSGLPGNGQVIGWHDKVWAEDMTAPFDGKTYNYVLANLNITDPAGAAKIENGTFRHRSAEVSTYTTNDEAEFWPAYMGVAYVDIPAVQGLQFSSSNVQPADGNGPRQVFIFMNDGINSQKETGVTTVPPAPAQGTPAPAPAAPVFGAPTQVVSYSIGGQSVTDPAAVQAQITALEMFAAQTTEANRANFVNGLATSGKVLATQVESLLGFVKTLNTEQFAAWSKTYDAAPAQSLTGNHAAGAANGASVTDTTAAGAAAGATAGTALVGDELDANVVKMMFAAGVAKGEVEKSASFQRLKTAGKAPVL